MAKEDSKSLVDEYNKGASIQELADKYELTPAEVEVQVVKPAPPADNQPKESK